MAYDGTYGNQTSLYAAANLYNADIQIVSSPGVGGQHEFGSTASVSAATVYLGHFAENQGEHYVSLEQVTDHNNGIEKEYEANDPSEGEISEDYANKMRIEQDVVDFEMGDTDAKSGPGSIVGMVTTRTLLQIWLRDLRMGADQTRQILNCKIKSIMVSPMMVIRRWKFSLFQM